MRQIFYFNRLIKKYYFFITQVLLCNLKINQIDLSHEYIFMRSYHIIFIIIYIYIHQIVSYYIYSYINIYFFFVELIFIFELEEKFVLIYKLNSKLKISS